MTSPDFEAELTFKQQQHITEILDQYRTNPSNSNKYRFELFAYFDKLLAGHNQALVAACEQVIGSDEPVPPIDDKFSTEGYRLYIKDRNALRAEQRQRLADLKGEEQ